MRLLPPEVRRQVIDERGAGLDGPKETGVACVLTPAGPEPRPWGTMTSAGLALSDGLLACGGTPGAMESTGDDWTAVFNLWEGSFEGLLANAPHGKAVPGHKPDVHEAAWLAELLPCGLWRASFMPPVAPRERRDRVRSRRTLIRDRATLVNRGQTRWADANIKLAAGATAMLGGQGEAAWPLWWPAAPLPRPWPSWPQAGGATNGRHWSTPWKAGATRLSAWW